MVTPTHKTPDYGAIEFELTDIDTARSALDELPAGVERAGQRGADYWAGRRRAPGHAERVLAASTLQWIARLPSELRPVATMQRYPWVVNRLAESWASAERCHRSFEDLLGDRRGGRRGFPFNVEAELRLIKQYRARQAGGRA
ncbi:MAG TPA: hypothetical protein VJ743_22435 [Albitalea sp.]|nr:hypothetical protein [Albitalea sp.]